MRKFWSCTFDPQLTYCVKILLRVWLMCIETHVNCDFSKYTFTYFILPSYYQFVGRIIFVRFPSMQQLPKLPKWDLKSFYIYFSFKSELSRAFSATQRDGVLRVTLKKDASKILSKTISKLRLCNGVKDVSYFLIQFPPLNSFCSENKVYWVKN